MSLRVELTKKNMDLIMSLVRKWDCKPVDVINELLSQLNVEDARSITYEENKVFKGNNKEE